MLTTAQQVNDNTVAYCQQKAWLAYIAQQLTQAAMNNPQTVIPWQQAPTACLAFRTALGNADSEAQPRKAKSSTL